jgi:PAS domain S-box-containing protein
MTDRFLTVIRHGWTASRIVTLYVLIASLWILFADQLITIGAVDQATHAALELIKGVSYVVVTAVLLRRLIEWHTAALRNSEEHYRGLFEHMSEGFAYCRMIFENDQPADWIYLAVNESFERLTGLREASGKRVSQLIPGLRESDPELFKTYGRVALTGQPKRFEMLVEALQMWFDVSVYSPQTGFFVAVFDVITDRKRAEEAFRQSQAFSQALIDHSPLGISVRGRTGQLLFANAAWRKIWAIAEADVQDDMTRQRAALRFNARDDYLMPYQADLRRVYEQGGYLHLPELKTTHPRPGAAEWVAQHFYAITDEQGQVDRVVVLTEDISDRKRTEQALRDSKEKFARAFRTSPYAIAITRAGDGQFIDVNEAFTSITGYTQAEALANSSLGLNLWVDIADRQRVVTTLNNGQPVIDQEVLFRSKTGDIIICLFSAQFMRIDNEQCILSSLNDITERKRAEAALRESETSLKFSQRMAHVGHWTWDTTTNKVTWSEEMYRVFGLDPETFDGDLDQIILQTIHPDDREKVIASNTAVLTDQKPAPMEYRVIWPDRSVRTIWAVPGGKTVDATGRILKLSGIVQDITERKQREREIETIAAMALALRAASTRAEMLPIIVQQIADLLKPDGVALILREAATGENVIVHGQSIRPDMIGLRFPPGAGIVGHVVTTGRPYWTQDATRDPYTYQPLLVGGIRAVGCVPLIAQDRTVGALWIGHATTIADEEVRLLSAIGDIAANALHRAEALETLEQRVYDRTRELAEANERLTELDRLKSKFVSDVSHELRTPITSLMLNVELLEHGKPEKREHYLHVIRQQTVRQVQLIEDILNLSRLERSTARAQFAPVNVNALVGQAVGVYRSSAEAANLRLNFTPDPGQPVVSGVESHLSQVVTNLIANAINYTPAGAVEVATRLADHEVVIEVCDTGLGIAAEDMPYLFDRFYRGKLTWQVRGSGLGLAIVKEITEVHKGRVEVDSQAGVGSTFRVYLPMV